MGLSNANKSDATKLTVIRRDPVPEAVKQHVEEVLSLALNEQHRPAKRKEFQSHNSEDAVTWVVFRYLQQEGMLGRVVSCLGSTSPAESIPRPTLLLWGAPVPPDDKAGRTLRQRLAEVCDVIGENHSSRSEPDVILDFGELGLCLIEVKLRSPNEFKDADYAPWAMYFNGTEAFRDEQRVRACGYYELARNWRIGWDLAGRRPLALVNLASASALARETDSLDRFAGALSTSEHGRFARVSWQGFLAPVLKSCPDWLQAFLKAREVLA